MQAMKRMGVVMAGSLLALTIVSGAAAQECGPLFEQGMSSRGFDGYGSGQFGAPRGSRSHKGLDVKAAAGDEVLSPIDGNVTRIAYPYLDDPSLEGIVLEGTGEYSKLKMKLFYVKGLFSGPVKKGKQLGVAQDLSQRYPGNMTNHVHMELYRDGKIVEPFEIYRQCF